MDVLLSYRLVDTMTVLGMVLIVLCFAFLVAGVPALIVNWLLARSKLPRGLYRTVRQTARHLHGTVRIPAYGEAHVYLPDNERPVQIDLVVADLPPNLTSISVQLDRPAPGVLKIAPIVGNASPADLPGTSRVSTGDPDFDAACVVRSTPNSLARQLFDSRRRGETVELVRRLLQPHGGRIDLSRDAFTVRLETLPEDEDALLSWVYATVQMVERVLAISISGEGALWFQEGEARIGQCQVCGTEMTRETVYCAKCRTPHHQECWAYLGRCATYACGERRFSATR